MAKAKIFLGLLFFISKREKILLAAFTITSQVNENKENIVDQKLIFINLGSWLKNNFIAELYKFGLSKKYTSMY